MIADWQHYGVWILENKDAKVATLANGQSIQYDALVSTMPLDITLRWLGQPDWADTLSHRWATPQHLEHPVALSSLPQQPL